MSDGSVTIRPSLLRLWLVFAVAMLPMVVIGAAMGAPLDDWFSLAAISIILAVGVLVMGLFAKSFFFTFRVSREGLQPFLAFFGGVVRWEDIKAVGVGFPFVFYVAGSTAWGLPFPRFVFLPRLWLVKEKEALRLALERYAPDGHVLRRVYLAKEGPVLREVLALTLCLVALLGFVGFLYYRKHDPLHEAVSAGKMAEVVEIMGTRPGLVKARDRFGRTPLHWAAQEGHWEIAEYLISQGAEVEVRDRGLGVTPLHVAAGCGHHDIVIVLLNNDANPDVKDEQGRTALDMAVTNRREAIAATLRRRLPGAEIKTQEESSKPARRPHEQ